MSMIYKIVVVFEGCLVFCKFVVFGLVIWLSDIL